MTLKNFPFSEIVEHSDEFKKLDVPDDNDDGKGKPSETSQRNKFNSTINISFSAPLSIKVKRDNKNYYHKILICGVMRQRFWASEALT